MKKSEALAYLVKNPNVILKLDWWTYEMGIKFDGKNFVSIPCVPIDTKFLLEGNYVLSDYGNDAKLGGLFSFLGVNQ